MTRIAHYYRVFFERERGLPKISGGGTLRSKRFLCRIAGALVSMIVLSNVSTVAAYTIDIINYYSMNQGENYNATFGQDNLHISDRFDQSSVTSWQVNSATDDGNGGVIVDYIYNQGVWDSYDNTMGFSFQITPGDRNTDVELVHVDVTGNVYLINILNTVDPFTRACCGSSDILLEAPGSHQDGSSFLYKTNSREDFDTYSWYSSTEITGDVDTSLELYTNTTYSVYYSTSLYIETWLGDGLQRYFSSWNEYRDFLTETGGSGASSSSAFGNVDYSLSIQPVYPIPEPETMLLFGTSLTALIGLRLRKK